MFPTCKNVGWYDTQYIKIFAILDLLSWLKKKKKKKKRGYFYPSKAVGKRSSGNKIKSF